MGDARVREVLEVALRVEVVPMAVEDVGGVGRVSVLGERVLVHHHVHLADGEVGVLEDLGGDPEKKVFVTL